MKMKNKTHSGRKPKSNVVVLTHVEGLTIRVALIHEIKNIAKEIATSTNSPEEVIQLVNTLVDAKNAYDRLRR